MLKSLGLSVLLVSLTISLHGCSDTPSRCSDGTAKKCYGDNQPSYVNPMSTTKLADATAMCASLTKLNECVQDCCSSPAKDVDRNCDMTNAATAKDLGCDQTVKEHMATNFGNDARVKKTCPAYKFVCVAPVAPVVAPVAPVAATTEAPTAESPTTKAPTMSRQRRRQQRRERRRQRKGRRRQQRRAATKGPNRQRGRR